jgi:hypothetical protein
MHGHPKPHGRDPGPEPDNRWQSVQEVSGELTIQLPDGLREQIRLENRKSQGIPLRAVDNALHLLYSAGLLASHPLGTK